MNVGAIVERAQLQIYLGRGVVSSQATSKGAPEETRD
jgi:hypothetical protein